MASRRPARALGSRGAGVPDAGYGLVSYVVMGAVALLIVAGTVLLIRMVMTGSDDSRRTEAAVGSITDCSESQWFDAGAGTCVARAECQPGEQYWDTTNTCILVPAKITEVSPSSGLATGGTTVRLTGERFEPGSTVLIDGTPASEVVVVNGTTITAVTPPSSSLYPVDVEVRTPNGAVGVLDNAFTYVALPVERARDVVPPTGSTTGGEAILVKGTGFREGVLVAIGGRAAPVVEFLDRSTLRVITPPGEAGRVPLNVRNPGEDAVVLEDGFRYVDQPPRVVAGVRPVKGPQAGGTKVTITGSGFADGATVTFGRNPARRVVVESSTRITAVTPAGRLGDVAVGVRNPGLPVALLEGGFTYVAAPTITAVKPARGPVEGGTKVTITGTGFGPDAVVGVGDVVIEDAKVVDESTIRIVMPPAAEPIKVDVSVTNPGEPRALAKRAFTYIEGEPEPEPTATPTPTARPTPVAQPACRPLRQPPQGTSIGADLILTDVDLFPASLRNPRLTSVSFTGTSGGNAGSVDWTARPSRIEWSAPDLSPATGVVTFAYQADNCQGTGAGSVITVFSD